MMDQIAEVDRFPEEDDEVFVPRLQYMPGGSAANFAVFCSRLGFESGFMGKVGKDALGDQLVIDLHKEGVSIDGVPRSRYPTGTVFVAVRSDGQRSMYAFSGAANDLKNMDIDTKYLKTFDHLHLADLENIDVLQFAADKFDGTVSLNAGALIAEKRIAARDLISKCDIFICSEEEAKKITDLKSAKDALKSLHKMGAKIAVMTKGSNSPWAYDGRHITGAPTFKVPVVDTTGAGDSFSAGFVCHYLKTKDIKDSLRFANATASIVIQNQGARGGLKNWKQVERVLKNEAR